jgi:hypothetical protein
MSYKAVGVRPERWEVDTPQVSFAVHMDSLQKVGAGDSVRNTRFNDCVRSCSSRHRITETRQVRVAIMLQRERSIAVKHLPPDRDLLFEPGDLFFSKITPDFGPNSPLHHANGIR